MSEEDLATKFEHLKEKEENVKTREAEVKDFQDQLGSRARPYNWPLPFKWSRPFVRHNIWVKQ
jgi:hypothetical protein